MRSIGFSHRHRHASSSIVLVLVVRLTNKRRSAWIEQFCVGRKSAYAVGVELSMKSNDHREPVSISLVWKVIRCTLLLRIFQHHRQPKIISSSFVVRRYVPDGGQARAAVSLCDAFERAGVTARRVRQRALCVVWQRRTAAVRCQVWFVQSN